MFALPHVATRLFGTPLAVAQSKLDVIIAAIGPRIITGAPMAFADMPSAEPVSMSVRAGGVAVLPIVGTLVNRASGMDALSGMQSYGEMGDMLLAAATDPQVSSILLELDTPGGEVGGLFDFADLIEQAKAETGKPIWALASENALSAGYAIASAADRVLVTQTGFLGSIGVVAAHVDQSKADAEDGMTWTLLHAGERKIDGNSHQPLSDEARASIQGMIDSTYDQFVAAVARRRGMDEKAVRATEAAIYRGTDAVQVGLADGVSTLRQALADMAGLKPVRKLARASSARPQTVRGQTMNSDVQAGAGDETPAEASTEPTIDRAAIEAAITERNAALVEFGAVAAKLGGKFDVAKAIREGMSLDAARKSLIDSMVASQNETPVSALPAKHPDHGSAASASAPKLNSSDIYAKRAAAAAKS